MNLTEDNMGLPKNYRKDLKITPHKQGFEQRQSILDDIANKGTYLPKGILHEDMDAEMINYVDNDIDLSLAGEKVPVIFLTAQRWAEFSKTWQYSDIDKNIKLPFITIVRKPDCNRMRDLNVMNRKMLTSFSALEKYIRVNGHPIPLILDSIGDESVINNLDERKYYVQLFTIKMMGYLLDEDEFVVTPAVSRGIQFYEISEELYRAPYQINVDDQNNTICINVIFQRGVSSVTIPIEIDATYNNLNVTNADSVIFKKNGVTVTLPFTVNNGDQLYIKVNKTDANEQSEVELSGTIL
jgi:hypothetical protein